MPTALELLKKSFAESQLRNSGWSVRAQARKWGLSSGALSEILNGKRPLTLKFKLKVVDKLNLSPRERRCFLEEGISERISQTQRQSLELSDDQFRLISDWWHFGILNLVKTRSFEPKISYLMKRLKASKEDLRIAWDRLFRMGLLVKNAQGKVERRHLNLGTASEITNLSLRKSHLEDLQLIESALNELSVDLRSTTSVTLCFDPRDLNRAKKVIDQFQDRFMEEFETGDGDEVYRLSMSLFPLTVLSKENL